MKTCNRFLTAVSGLLLLGFFMLVGSRATAQTVTLMSTQDFSSSSPWGPSGWSGSFGTEYSYPGQYFWTSSGSGGSNGSAVSDVWDYAGSISTPSVDASSYAQSGDSVWVDFDFFWEYNEYDADGYGDDTFELEAGSDILMSGTEATLNTYSNSGDGNFDVIQTSSSYWVHYHVLIPSADRTSTLSISFIDAPNWGCSDFAIDNVSITGSSVPPGKFSLLPKSLNFGVASPNSPVTLCVTAYSLGVAPVHITGYGLSGSSAYSLVSGPAVGDSIMPGNTAQYCIQFLPLGAGNLAGSFTVQTDAPDSGTQSVGLMGVGSVPSVSYGVTNLFRREITMLGDTSPELYIPVTSTGLAPLHFFTINFIGLNANDYFVSRMPQNPLPSDVTDSIGITFTPTVEGQPDASVIISTDAVNQPLDTVRLFGIGALPHLVITVPPPGSGNTVAFDSVAIGDSVCQTLTLTNPGTDTLQILKQLVTYGDYDFTYHPLTGTDTTILPGGTALVNVCFKPLKMGTRLASIRFYTNIPPTFDHPRQDTSQFVINVTGIGVPYGELSASGQFDDTAIVGKTNCITESFVNNGQSDLTITGARITGPDSSAFVLSGATIPFTLAPGGMQTVSLCFTAATRGSQFDTLVLSGTTSEKSVSVSFLLTGVGVITCVSATQALTFGADSMTFVGAMDTSCITVTNCGDLSATYTAALPPGTGYTLLPPLTSASIPAGGTADFCVTFNPTAIGAASSSVTITGGPAPATTTLGGVGAGIVASATGAPEAAVPVDTCNTFDITVTNTGNVAWTPGAGTISGSNATDFTIVSGPTPAVIPPNGTATVSVSFCPKTQGTESMTLTFPSENPVPVAGAFSYSTTGIGAASSVTIKTEQDGFTLGPSYPNPTNGSAAISVTLPYDAPARIDLIDATGAFISNAFSGRLVAGTQTVAIDAKGLPSGTYFYMFSSGDVHLTRQLNLIK